MSARLTPGGLFKRNSRLPVAASAYWSMATMIALDVLHRVAIGISLGWSSTEVGRLLMTIMGGFAEFERGLIRAGARKA
jgi:hypothetical protein